MEFEAEEPLLCHCMGMRLSFTIILLLMHSTCLLHFFWQSIVT